MIFSKLLILVVYWLLPVQVYQLEEQNCDFQNICYPHGSWWWERHATYCFRCSIGKIYHCARDYDYPHNFREGCAINKTCLAGEEPYLSFLENGIPIDEPIVHCQNCEDINTYNDRDRLSYTFSQCPYEKQDCSEDKHKIVCKNGTSKEDRFCRCDARKGYYPINDDSNKKCSYKNYLCEKYECPTTANGEPQQRLLIIALCFCRCDARKGYYPIYYNSPEMCSYKSYECEKYDCPKTSNGDSQQRLLNYTCAPYCQEGYARLKENSDTCELIPTKTSTTIKPAVNTTSDTTDPTDAPVPSNNPVKGCAETCDEQSVCRNGTCACLDTSTCPSDYIPVCGYDSDSEEYKTFDTKCKLLRTFCKERKFHFKHHGECEKKENAFNQKWIILFAVLGAVVFPFIIYVIHKSCLGKKCRDKFWPYKEYSADLDITYHVVAEKEMTSAVDGNNSGNRDNSSNQLTGNPVGHGTADGNLDRQTSKISTKSAPLAEPEEVTYTRQTKRNPQPMIINKTTNIYHGPVVKTIGGHTDVSIPDQSNKKLQGEMKVQYNKGEARNGEDRKLLDSDSESEREDLREQQAPAEVHQPPPMDTGGKVDINKETIDRETDDSGNITGKHEKVDEQENDVTSKKPELKDPNAYKKHDELKDPNSNEKHKEFKDSNELKDPNAKEKQGELIDLNAKKTQGELKDPNACDKQVELKDPKDTSTSNDEGDIFEHGKLEADGVEKKEAKQLSSKNEVVLKRTSSVSHESLQLKPDIMDVEQQFTDKDEYKKMTDMVLDRCLTDLLNYMDPITILRRFTEKGMFDHTSRRNVKDLTTTTDKSEKIIEMIRQSGEQNYNKFKECLRDTKQLDCLRKILREQNNVLADMKPHSFKDSHKRFRHNSDSVPDLLSITDYSLPLDNTQKRFEYPEKPRVVPIPPETVVPNESVGPTYVPSEPIGPVVPSVPSGPIVKPSYPLELERKEVENKSKKYLIELSDFMKIDREGVTIGRDKKFEMFVKMCTEMKASIPELTVELLVSKLHIEHELQEMNYGNTPKGYTAYASSGEENSCLYQSVSLLLSGSEDLQYSLRLLTTLHAVSFFRDYKKQLLHLDNTAEDWKVFFARHIDDKSFKKISELENDAETIIDACLKVLMMETASIGTDSSVLHVSFLCGALGVNIQQHFQHNYTEYGEKKEDVPWIKYFHDDIKDGNIADMHIFWVNYSNNESERMNHIVPLLEVPEDAS